MLVSLWLWASQNATNGDLSGCSDRAIAEAAEYKRKPAAFVNALIKTKWLDADRKLHDWEEYATLLNDCAEQQKQKTRERVKRHRDRKRAAANAEVTPDCNGDCNATDTLSNAPTTPHHTVPYHTNTFTGDDDGDAGAREADSEMLSRIGVKPGEYAGITVAQVDRAVRHARSLFARYLHREPAPWDCKKVFIRAYNADSAGLLEYAFEVAALAGKPGNWPYIEGILDNLAARDIRTVAQAKAWDEERPDKYGEDAP